MFVGSLPAGAKPEELRRLFENYGVVTECDVMNRCGFVHMQNPDMASSAIEALNNSNFKGATISVEPGRMKERGGGSGPRRSQPGNRGGDGGFRGNNQRGGGSGGMMGNRGRSGMMGNRGQRDGGFGGGRNFGENNNNGMGGGGFGNGSGPMRRDNRGGNQRNAPYNRGGGGSGGGDNVNFGGRSGGSFGGRSGFGNDRFDNRPSMSNRGGTFFIKHY